MLNPVNYIQQSFGKAVVSVKLQMKGKDIVEMKFNNEFGVGVKPIQFTEVCSKFCSTMESLDCRYFYNLRDSVITAIAPYCCNLKSLDLRGCFDITDDAMISLLSNAKQLTYLNITGCHKITELSILTLARKCQNITELYTHGIVLTDNAVLAIARIRGIHSISITGDFSELALNRILTLKLTYLHLRNCYRITDTYISANRYPDIQYFQIDNGWKLTDVSEQFILKNCPNIKHLEINKKIVFSYIDPVLPTAICSASPGFFKRFFNMG